MPTRKEWQLIFDHLSKREKTVFFFLFLAAWTIGTLILIKIDKDYSTTVPARGGTLMEGLVGAPRFINPLLASSDADRDLTRLIYAGLMKADGHGGLAPDLAERYEVTEDGLTYTFFLREGLTWHDGKPLTAHDVVFTVELATNPEIRSSKFARWEGIRAVATSDREVKFHLKKPFAPFLDNTTLGILPKHLWEKIHTEEFSLTDLNTAPVGAGPFRITDTQKTETGSIIGYTLRQHEDYRPEPAFIKQIFVTFYSSETNVAEALKNGELTSGSVLLTEEFPTVKSIDINMPRIFGVFLNENHSEVLKDSALRNALKKATDRNRIVQEVAAGHATATSLPIPPGTFGYDRSLDDISSDIEASKEILKKAGYEDSDGDGIVEKKISDKERRPARIELATSNAPELLKTAEAISNMWKIIGVEVTVKPYDLGDLQETIIRPRSYDALLFGQVVGSDPDPFAFWHTSQRNHPGVNVSLYANTKVDKILEEARITTDNEKRKNLYRDFQIELQKDIPAIFLYSPTYVYAIPTNLKGISVTQVPLPEERFSTINDWYVETKKVWNILLPLYK